MEGGRGARRLASSSSSSGRSWAAFEETAKDYGTGGRERGWEGGGHAKMRCKTVAVGPAREIGGWEGFTIGCMCVLYRACQRA